MSTLTDYEIEQIQLRLNQSIYEDILKYREYILNIGTDDKQAVDILISSIATNIGVVLSQIPDSYKESYRNTVHSIIDNSYSKSIETVDTRIWGQIGHA